MENYPTNRPNKSSFFVGYQPAGNLDTEPLWRLAGARLGRPGQKSSGPAKKEEQGPLDALANDAAFPHSRIEKGKELLQKAFEKYGTANPDYVYNTKEGKEALAAMYVSPQEALLLAEQKEQWGEKSKWQESVNKSGDLTYLPGGWQNWNKLGLGGPMSISQIDELRKNDPRFSIQSIQANGMELTPNSSLATSEDAMKYLRGVYDEVASLENQGESGLQLTGLPGLISTITGSNNHTQIENAKRNLLGTIPSEVQDGLFQMYSKNAIGSDIEAFKEYQKTGQIPKGYEWTEKDKSLWDEENYERFINTSFSRYMQDAVTNTAYQFMQEKQSADYMNDPNYSGGGNESDLGYMNFASVAMSGVPSGDERPSGEGGFTIAIDRGNAAGVYGFPAKYYSNGVQKFLDELAEKIPGGVGVLEKEDENFGKSQLKTIPLDKALGGNRLMIMPDGSVTNTQINADFAKNAVIVKGHGAYNAFPKEVWSAAFDAAGYTGGAPPTMAQKTKIMEVMGRKLHEQSGSQDPYERVSQNFYTTGVDMYSALEEMLKNGNWNINNIPSAWIEVDLAFDSNEAENITRNLPYVTSNQPGVGEYSIGVPGKGFTGNVRRKTQEDDPIVYDSPRWIGSYQISDALPASTYGSIKEASDRFREEWGDNDLAVIPKVRIGIYDQDGLDPGKTPDNRTMNITGHVANNLYLNQIGVDPNGRNNVVSGRSEYVTRQ